MQEYKKQYQTLGIAAAGVYASGIDSMGNQFSSTIYDRNLSAYLGELIEGGTVIDKRPCINHPDFYRMVINGPMLDAFLPEKTRSGWNGKVPCDSWEEAKGFDSLSLDLYIAMWKTVGARVGKRVEDSIEWEDKDAFGDPQILIQLIPPAEERFSAEDYYVGDCFPVSPFRHAIAAMKIEERTGVPILSRMTS